MIKQIRDIIEHPRKPHSPNQPEYESDVYNIDSVERENKRNLASFNRLNDGTGPVEVNVNFAARRNTRKE